MTNTELFIYLLIAMYCMFVISITGGAADEEKDRVPSV